MTAVCGVRGEKVPVGFFFPILSNIDLSNVLYIRPQNPPTIKVMKKHTITQAHRWTKHFIISTAYVLDNMALFQYTSIVFTLTNSFKNSKKLRLL